MQNQSEVRYKLYATLLDAWQDYLDTPQIYDRYWGYSNEPPHTLEEFWVKQHASLIDRINRVPFTSEAASKGTAFNAVIDTLITGQLDEKVKMSKVLDENGKPLAVQAELDGFTFRFPYEICKEFALYYKGAIPQVRVSAIFSTMYGNVELYGYIDELMPLSVHDIKYTGNYSASKFKHHSQHLVYPYCLILNGSNVRTFEYNVAEESKSGNWQTYTETYVFDPARDIPILRERCEGLIEFALQNRQLITDRKIFGGENPDGYVGEPIDIHKLMQERQ
jgi:hypothetical protein